METKKIVHPLRKWRKTNSDGVHYTQVELGKIFRLTQPRISQIENYEPTGGGLAVELAAFTGIPVEVFLSQNKKRRGR
jgi:hypothetical protein